MSDFKSLIFSPVLQAGAINRYSGLYLIKPESVSDHTFQVCVLTLVIGEKCIANGENLDLGKALTFALVHDFDEVLSADIPRTVKYFHPKLRSLLEEVSKTSMELLATQLDLPWIPGLWASAKKEGKEGFIVAMADTLQCVKKLVEEVEYLGNQYMLRAALELHNYVQELISQAEMGSHSFRYKSTKYLSSLLQCALEIINDILAKHAGVIEQLGFEKLRLRSQ